MIYRPLYSGLLGTITGEPWPAWVRAMRGKSGVYVIRSAMTKETIYVGESHTGRLYDTFTRHFQSWSGKTAGPTYSRAAVEVALLVAPAGSAVEKQNRLIVELKPLDNTVSPAGPIEEEDPF